MRTVLRNMYVQVQEKLQKRFNSAYFISKENLALTVDYNVDYNELKAMVLYDLSLGIYARPRVRTQKY